MPALPPAQNVLLVRVVGTNQGSIWNNVFHLQYTGTAPGTAEQDALSSQILALYNTSFGALMNTSCQASQVFTFDLTSPTAAEGSASGGAPGTRTGTDLPVSAATVISWHINVRYRGGHPRTYGPFGVIADLTEGRLFTTAFTAAVQTAATSFRGGMNALISGSTTYKMVTLSYFTGRALRPAPIPFTITGNSVHDRLDSQRRRLGKELP